MLKNFLKIAYRNLFKYKYYSIINVLGFALGISAFAIAYIYAIEELSYDSYLKNSDRICRITQQYEKDSTLNDYATTPFPLASALKQEFKAEIKEVARLFNFQNNFHLIEYNDKHFNEKYFYYADSTIIDVFDFNFIRGSRKQALVGANTVIISQSISEKYFGNSNPVGKEILINEGFPMTITAVFKEIPKQSHLKLDIITSFKSLYKIMEEPQTWLWSPCWTYVLLNDDTAISKVEKKLPLLIQDYFDKTLKDYTRLFLQPITSIHLDSDLESEITPNSRSLYLYILLGISLFLLLVSFLNFVNLSVVGSITRIREISIRKILGSSKRLIVFQFIAEGVLLSLISLITALFLIELFIPLINFMTNQEIKPNMLINNGTFAIIFSVSLLAGTIVGIYTGYYASSFPTFNIGRLKYFLARRKWFSGKVLILVQYVISLVLLIAVFINFKQLVYLKTKELGFDEKNIVILPVTNTNVAEEYTKFKSYLLKNPAVESVTAANHVIGATSSHRRYFYYSKGIKKVQFFPELIVRQDFINTMGIPLLAGNNLRDAQKENSGIENAGVIINESLVKSLNFKGNNEAIGKKLFSFVGNERIVGVIKDFNTRSLHRPVGPLVIRLSTSDFNASEDTKYLIIKFKARVAKKTHGYLAKLWQKFVENRPLEMQLLDEFLDAQYKNEDTLNKFLWLFSLIIIIVSSMGVWAITSLLSIQRTKEIGIRKALGASVKDILYLFLKDFTNILLIATIFAWPVSWLIIRQWFKNFAHHTSVGWLVYVYASVFILMLTLGIVAKHALKVANTNTVNSLRDE